MMWAVSNILEFTQTFFDEVVRLLIVDVGRLFAIGYPAQRGQ